MGWRQLVKGLPWKWNPDEQDKESEFKVGYLSEEEMIGKAAPQIEDDRRIYRLRLQKSDFVKYGFTQGCPGCQAIVSGT